MSNFVVIRRIIAVILIALLTLTAVRLSFLDGLLRRVTIDGPSMAPAFCGAHYSVTCHDCGFQFPCDAEHLPTDGRAACPNCGYTANSLGEADFKPADQVLIDRWPLLWAGPRRGDVVATTLPDTSDIAVKRIAGLPGEQLSIVNGDLFADAKIIRKTVADLEKIRLLVHDNHFQPAKTPGLQPRWRPESEKSRWQKTDSGFRYSPSSVTIGDYDWLQYEHWKCTADEKTRGIASPITDNDSYNQGEIHRPLNFVNDVLVSCRVKMNGKGRLALIANVTNDFFEAEIEPGRVVILRSAQGTLAEKQLKKNFSRRFMDVEFGLYDQQVLLNIDGRAIIQLPYDLKPGSTSDSLRTLAIGADEIEVHLQRLRVWRDIYHLDPQGLSRPWQMRKALGNDEYAVFGDNQPVSIDSRHWEPSGVPRSSVLGCVYRPFWVSHRLD